MSLQITEDIAIPLSEITITYCRSGGPGGQNVNKVSSKALLVWNPYKSAVFATREQALQRLRLLYPSHFSKEGELHITSSLTRAAPRNRQDCLEKLANMLRRALHEKKRRIPTRPSKGAAARRLDEKARNSQKKANRRGNFL
ncbi:MAG: alternative ribosome rescue aminoacyl-tRNA hydrolase ArfB [Planctomycetia bacterium]|nr:alternative ribosome rescue aminoacyl-tRNA hydrolase ArfB [Planctomycetia bacterium]